MIRRFALMFVAGVLLQGVTFAWYYSDLLYLRAPATTILAGEAGTFAREASEALSRETLTRRHLDTIAEAAQGFELHAIEIQTLEKQLEMDAGDHSVRLRLADALRRAGQYDRAESMFLEVLRAVSGESR